MKIYEQVDKIYDKPVYSWILEAPYKLRHRLIGWKWIRGKPGCYVTNDREVALNVAK